MKTIKTNEWGNLKLGDIIVAYHKGYHRIVSIERRFITEELLNYACYKNEQFGNEINPIIYYIKIATPEGKIRSNKSHLIENCCDYFFCRKAIEVIDEKIKNLKQTKSNLLDFMKSGS